MFEASYFHIKRIISVLSTKSLRLEGARARGHVRTPLVPVNQSRAHAGIPYPMARYQSVSYIRDYR